MSKQNYHWADYASTEEDGDTIIDCIKTIDQQAKRIEELEDSVRLASYKVLMERNKELSNDLDAMRSLAYQWKSKHDELEQQNKIMRDALDHLTIHSSHPQYDNNWAVYTNDIVRKALAQLEQTK